MVPLDEDLTEEEALTMALLLGFEWSDCEWCHDNSYCCFNCIYTHWGICCAGSREEAVWRYLLQQGVISRIPVKLEE